MKYWYISMRRRKMIHLGTPRRFQGIKFSRRFILGLYHRKGIMEGRICVVTSLGKKVPTVGNLLKNSSAVPRSPVARKEKSIGDPF